MPPLDLQAHIAQILETHRINGYTNACQAPGCMFVYDRQSNFAADTFEMHQAAVLVSELRLEDVREALFSADSILSLLQHRGIADSDDNRRDVHETSDKLSSLRKTPLQRTLL